jgi:hypothetical protein
MLNQNSQFSCFAGFKKKKTILEFAKRDEFGVQRNT